MNSVRWSQAAHRDFRNLVEWIGDRNPAAALRIIDAIQNRVETLKTFPRIGRPGRVEGTRELVVSGTPYLVIYEIADTQDLIVIIRVLHSAQRWPPKS